MWFATAVKSNLKQAPYLIEFNMNVNFSFNQALPYFIEFKMDVNFSWVLQSYHFRVHVSVVSQLC